MEKKNIDWANLGFGYITTENRFVANYDGKAWDEGKITTEPTIDSEGVKTYTCVCGYTKIESVAKLPHDHTFATEWSSDATHHWHAATCTHTSEIADKAEHTWNEGSRIGIGT